MSSDWKEVSLDEIADLNGGYAFKSEEYTEVGHFVLRTVNISDDGRICQDGAAYVSPASAKKYERFQLKDLDTLFVMVGATLGKTGLVKAGDLPALLNQNMWVVRAKTDQVDPLFLHYAFKVISRPMCSLASGSARGFVKRDDFRQMRVRVPEIRVQRRISDLLGAIDDRITLLRETNTTLEAIAQALFKSWFVDFDPVHAKMQGRAPEGMDEATAALFPDSFEDSELGPVPKGWRFGIISDLGEVICGKTPPTSNPENYGDAVPFITIPDMHNRLVVTNTGRSLSMTGANSQKKKNLPAGSICVSCIATPGLVVRVTRESQTNQQINSVVPLPTWGKSFPLFLLLRIGDAVRAAGSGGSVFHNLSKSGFEAINVLLTSYELAQKFDEMVEPLIARIEANQKQLENLAATRDTLLPRLISGQLNLTEVATETI
jgi:type I restriction enzyme S subunit